MVKKPEVAEDFSRDTPFPSIISINTLHLPLISFFIYSTVVKIGWGEVFVVVLVSDADIGRACGSGLLGLT